MFLGRKKFESVKWGHGHYQLLGHSFRTSVVRNSNTTFTYFVNLCQQANLVGVGGGWGGGGRVGGGGRWNSWKMFESVKWGHGHYQLLGHIFRKSVVRNSNTMFTYFVKLCLQVKFGGGRAGGEWGVWWAEDKTAEKSLSQWSEGMHGPYQLLGHIFAHLLSEIATPYMSCRTVPSWKLEGLRGKPIRFRSSSL